MSTPIWVIVVGVLLAVTFVSALTYAFCRTHRKRSAQPPPKEDLEANRPQKHIKNKAGPHPVPQKPQRPFHGQQVNCHPRQAPKPLLPIPVENETRPSSNFHRVPGARSEYSFGTRTHNQRAVSPPPRDNTVSPMTVIDPATGECNRQGRTRTRHERIVEAHHRADESRSGVKHQRKSGRSLPRAPMKVEVEPERIPVEVRWDDRLDSDRVDRRLRRKR